MKRTRQLQGAAHIIRRQLIRQSQRSPPENSMANAQTQAQNSAVNSVENAMETGTIYAGRTVEISARIMVLGAKRIITLRQKSKQSKQAASTPPPVYDYSSQPLPELPRQAPPQLTSSNTTVSPEVRTRLELLRQKNLNPTLTPKADSKPPPLAEKIIEEKIKPKSRQIFPIKDVANSPRSTKDRGAVRNFYSRKKETKPTKPTITKSRTNVGGTSTGKEARARFAKRKQTELVINRETHTHTKKNIVQRFSKAVVEVVKKLKMSPVPVITAVSIVLIAAIIFGGVAAVIGSPYGIFFSGEDTTEDTMPLSAVQSRIQAEYNAKITELEDSISHDAVIRHGNMPDFVDVIAVFAVRTTTREDEFGADVATIDQARADMICEIFWDMCVITTSVTEYSEDVDDGNGDTVTVTTRVLNIYTTPKSYDEMPDYYNFTRQQKEVLHEFMLERDALTELVGGGGWYSGGAASIGMSDVELYELAAYYGVTLPEDLSIERKNVLAAALAGMQINIPYHYDWRSYYKVFPGIEGNDFGSPTSADYKGRNRKGLDCSGFVGWAYYSGGATWSNFGYGEAGDGWSFLATPGMRSVSSTRQISAEQLKPGDIGFLSNSAAGTSDHTGIFLGTTASGVQMWIHCAGSSGAVCTSYNFGVLYTVSGMDQTFGERKTGGTVGTGDFELLAQLIFYEGRGYGSTCMELIAQVAVNRMNSPKFKNQDTITEVLQAPGQYGYGRTGMTAQLIFHGDITQHQEFSDELWQKCLTAAQRVADGTSRDENGNKWPENVLYQHSFSDRAALGAWYKSYTDSSGLYTEHFNYG